MSKLIAVTGATGAQGGGLVRAILSNPDSGFTARAITRNPGSDAARALAEQGVSVVKADLDDKSSLAEAFTGAHGAYCVTNFWEHFSPQREHAQAANLAAAARSAGVTHAIWSTLEDVREFVPTTDDRMPTLMEDYKVPHFDAKGAADEIFRIEGVPTTFLRTSFYWDNMVSFGLGPKRGDDGTLTLTLPIADAKLPGIAAQDIGACALGVFAAGERWVGETVGIAGGHLTGVAMAAALSQGLGETVGYAAVPPDVFRTFGFPGAEDLGNMFQFNTEFADSYCAARDLDTSRELHPGLLTFEQWVAENADKIPLD